MSMLHHRHHLVCQKVIRQKYANTKNASIQTFFVLLFGVRHFLFLNLISFFCFIMTHFCKVAKDNSSWVRNVVLFVPCVPVFSVVLIMKFFYTNILWVPGSSFAVFDYVSVVEKQQSWNNQTCCWEYILLVRLPCLKCICLVAWM